MLVKIVIIHQELTITYLVFSFFQYFQRTFYDLKIGLQSY